MLPSTFRTVVQEIHQIELTSRCSLKCSYCPSSKMQAGVDGFRKTVDMAEDDFVAVLDLLRHFVDRGTQTEVNLAGIGESTLLGDRFIDCLRRVRDVVGPHRHIVLSTNGLHVTDEFAEKLKPYNPRIHVSLHVGLKRAKPAISALKKVGLYDGNSVAASDESVSWAGQVDWPDDASNFDCHWLAMGRVAVFADGRIGACSLDASGITSIGDVKALRDAALSGHEITTGTSPLCRKCHHRLPDWDQTKAEKFNDQSALFRFQMPE